MSRQNTRRKETLLTSSRPQPTEHKVVRIKGDESAANAAALWQEGEILNLEGSSKSRIDRHLKTLPPVALLTDEQFLAATKIITKRISSGTTAELVVKMPDSVVEQLIQEKKMTKLSKRELALEIINFVDEEDAIIGSDHIYETILNNLIIEGKITQAQKHYLMDQIRIGMHDHRNIIRNVDISVRDQKNQEVDHTADAESPDVVEEQDTVPDVVEEGETVADYVTKRDSGAHRRSDAVAEAAPEEELSPREQRALRHQQMREKSGQTPQQTPKREKKGQTPKPEAEQIREIVEEIPTAKKVKAAVLAMLGMAMIGGQAFAGVELANYIVEVWQMQQDYMILALILMVVQLTPGLAFAGFRATRKMYRMEITNNWQLVQHMSGDYALMSLGVLVGLGVIGYVPTGMLDGFVEYYGLQGLPLEAQLAALKEKAVDLGIKAGVVVGLIALFRFAWKERQNRHAPVQQKKTSAKQKTETAQPKGLRKLLKRGE